MTLTAPITPPPAPHHPYSLQIEITSHCNLSCVMCPLTTEQTASGIRKGHVTDLVWDEVKGLARHAERVVVAGFGEPLVNRRALPLLRELNDMGVPVSMTTNAHALTPEAAQALVAMPMLYHINISIDSPDPQIYQEVRGGPLDRALRGVRNLMAAGVEPERVTVSSVLMEENIASLAAMPALLAELGVRRYILQGLSNFNYDDPTKSLVNQGLLARHIPEIEAACRAHGVDFLPQQGERLDLEVRDPAAALAAFYHQGDRANSARQCTLPWEQPYIDKDGLVYPCCFAASKNQAVLGDINKASLQQIWLSPTYEEFRANMLDGATTPGICRECLYAPIGQHPLRHYAARLVPERSQLTGVNTARVVFQNIGEATWTPETKVRIGTSQPRGRPSRYVTGEWLSAERPGSFREALVPPGGYATFELPIWPDHNIGTEWFQLLVEGESWLPGTEFAVSFSPEHHAPRPIGRSEIARALGPSGWRAAPTHNNGLIVDRLDVPGAGSLLVRAPIFCVDTEGRRYHQGETVPAGVACTVWFDQPISA